MSKEQLQNPPDVAAWRALYDAAAAYQNLACWEWMTDSDIFGVQNPQTGEIGYCCIMGNLGEFYGYALYLGTPGLRSYYRMAEEYDPVEPPDPVDIYEYQQSLMLSFGDRQELEKEDRDVIKQLGLKFRGRNNWPCFRNYRPGYMPWFVDRDDAAFLTLALEQTLDVARRFKDDPNLLVGPKPDLYLVRVCEEKNGQPVWRDEWRRPDVLEEKIEAPASLDPQRVKRILERGGPERRGAIEFDMFTAPFILGDKDERPFFPKICLWVDHVSGFIFGTRLVNPDKAFHEMTDHFLGLLENHPLDLPDSIRVAEEHIFYVLEPLMNDLDIRVELVDDLEMLDEAEEALMEDIMQQNLR